MPRSAKPPRQPAEATRQAAQAWHARLRQEVDELERARFLAWLDEPDNARAWREQLELWELLQEPAERLGRGGWYRPRARRPRSRLAWGMAAAVLVGLLGIGQLWRDPGLYARSLADAATAPGERRQLVLADGSTVLLDGDSAVDVDDGAQGRRIVLRRGRAAFVVAALDTPFVVVSDGVEIEDLSTRFTVERGDRDSTVAVELGAVEVRQGGGRAPFRLDAGQGASGLGSGRAMVAGIDPAAAAGWQRGVLLYQDAPLERVAAELQRYSRERIVVAGARARARRVTGTFRTEDPAAALDALQAALEVEVVRIPGVVAVIR